MVRDGVLAEMIMVRPIKVQRLLEDKKKGQKFAWYSDEVHLIEDRLVGQFDFKLATRDQPQNNCIDSVQWEELLKFSEVVDTSKVDAIDPFK